MGRIYNGATVRPGILSFIEFLLHGQRQAVDDLSGQAVGVLDAVEDYITDADGIDLWRGHGGKMGSAQRPGRV